MLYLTTAWETPDRAGDPAVLYCGGDAGKSAQAVIDAPANFKRVETAMVYMSVPATLPTVRKPAVAKRTPKGAPSREQGLAMAAEIERLTGELAAAHELLEAASKNSNTTPLEEASSEIHGNDGASSLPSEAPSPAEPDQPPAGGGDKPLAEAD